MPDSCQSSNDDERLILEIYRLAAELAARNKRARDPDDVVQSIVADCLVRLRAGVFGEAPLDPAAYAATLVRRYAASAYRAAKIRRGQEKDFLRDRKSAPPAWMAPDRFTEEEELRALQDGVMARMPYKRALCYRLVRLDGLSYEEAAARLGVSTECVHKHVVRAQQRCRAEIASLGIELTWSSHGGRPSCAWRRPNGAPSGPAYPASASNISRKTAAAAIHAQPTAIHAQPTAIVTHSTPNAPIPDSEPLSLRSRTAVNRSRTG
jgi:RNA polymerase sigma-70 factor (ECF subfamily)